MKTEISNLARSMKAEIIINKKKLAVDKSINQSIKQTNKQTKVSVAL